MIFPAVEPLCRELRSRGLHVTIETAGTVDRPVECDLMSISPKLAHSTPEGRLGIQHERLRFQPEILQRLMAAYPYQLKFVVSHPDDLDEIERMLERISADRARVILMPEGVEPKILHERGVWLAEIAKVKGFRFSPRLHLELWGNRRGV
jgi:7-carboxy-7-deazaguanine synthase